MADMLELATVAGSGGGTVVKVPMGIRLSDLVAEVQRMPDVRMDKVRRMRRLIALGKLETPNRIEETVRRLMEELGP
jgi:hypothetical protein